MDIFQINECLAIGRLEVPGLFPRLDRLKKAPYVFKVNFGLDKLPLAPGILLIRGARQYGKSTWLEQEIYKTIQAFGAGSAFYLNGEHVTDVDALETAIETLLVAFKKETAVRRIFIDEITAIPHWEMALKRMADRGKLDQVLIVTTGSKAVDLHRGAERLPGRKGQLPRTTYLFTPIAYSEFHRVCFEKLGKKTFLTYLLSGGSPIACAELASSGIIPEYVIELTRDWVEGEIAASQRSRAALLNILTGIFRFAGTPLGQAKLARESGLANNTVAAGYIEILNDLGCVIPSYPWDPHRKITLLRKPCKYPLTNLLVAIAYHPAQIRTVEDFLNLSEQAQGAWYEWFVAQELVRRRAIEGKNMLAPLCFWQNKNHEIDFVLPPQHFLEVKRGQTGPIEFSWFAQQFPHQQLTVVSASTYETDFVQGVTFENFFLQS